MEVDGVKPGIRYEDAMMLTTNSTALTECIGSELVAKENGVSSDLSSLAKWQLKACVCGVCVCDVAVISLVCTSKLAQLIASIAIAVTCSLIFYDQLLILKFTPVRLCCAAIGGVVNTCESTCQSCGQTNQTLLVT